MGLATYGLIPWLGNKFIYMLVLKKIKMNSLKFDLLDTSNAFNILNDLLLDKNLIELAKHCQKNCNESLPYELKKTKEWIDKFLLTLDK